jgi:hypothetical protein
MTEVITEDGDNKDRKICELIVSLEQLQSVLKLYDLTPEDPRR